MHGSLSCVTTLNFAQTALIALAHARVAQGVIAQGMVAQGMPAPAASVNIEAGAVSGQSVFSSAGTAAEQVRMPIMYFATVLEPHFFAGTAARLPHLTFICWPVLYRCRIWSSLLCLYCVEFSWSCACVC